MHNSKQVTFVSAYYTIESTPYFNFHPEEWDPSPIFELARLGIQLCLYIGPNCAFESIFEDLEKECPNFRLMPYRLYYKDMWVYKTLQDRYTLPKNRNMDKDTLEYMVYMHSRHEIIEDAISENPWESTHFAWIDFNAPKLFSKKQDSFTRLQEIAKYSFPLDTSYFAGCWSKLDEEAAKNITASIHWRFCGAFFLGDIKSFNQFAELYRSQFPLFLEETGIFCWEVNFWAWLEYRIAEWQPTWYRGDHNDNMLNIFTGVSADTYATPLQIITTPAKHSVALLMHGIEEQEIQRFFKQSEAENPLESRRQNSILSKKEYEYPVIESFLPGSASYVEHLGKHYLNTRFVNYWMYPNGYYRFHNPELVIENRNYLSELDAETLEPYYFREMCEKTIYGTDGNPLLPPKRDKRSFSVGLEDIRLFSGPNEKVRFIATNVEYSPVPKNRMILGTYDLEAATYRDCQVVVPPDANSWCEKNWIPILFSESDSDIKEERFIYKWSPMEIGRVDPITNQLQIVLRYEVSAWIFSRLRGSTTFIDAPLHILPKENQQNAKETEYLVGLAHFSEEHSPRHYYHLLILLEKKTLKPVRYSRVFYFEKLSIEFCIGMSLRIFQREPLQICGYAVEDVSGSSSPPCTPFAYADAKHPEYIANYVFWISRFDRDPVCIEVDTSSLPFDNVV